MKKYLFAIGLSVLLVGCSGNDATTTFTEKIEDFSNYDSVTDVNAKSFVPVCDEYSETFAQKVKEGEVKQLSLYASGDYDLDVYMTPNYDNWTESDFSKVNNCGELGSITVVKIVEDSLLWSYSNCTAGAVPSSDQMGYEAFVECTAVEKELDQYLGY